MVADRRSVDLDGVAESLRSADSEGPAYSFDIGRTWTITVSYKPAVVVGAQTIFHLNDFRKERNDNTIMLEARGTGLRTLIVGAKGHGYPSKMFDYYGVLATGTWSHTTLTWDSNTQALNLYQDGVLHAPSETILNDRWVALNDSQDKSLWIGENKDDFSREFHGRIHSLAVWNTVLPVSRIATITGSVTANFSDAQHWWRLGFDPTVEGLGLDYGSSATSIDVNQASSKIEADDVVYDYPGKPDTEVYIYSSDQYNVDFFTDAGSPASGDWIVVIDPNVTLASTGTGVPSAETGVFPGSLTVHNYGRIQGRGGDGGLGNASAGKNSFHGGGGGGGAGSDPGLGMESGGGTGIEGADGTSESGGAGGVGGNNVLAHGHSSVPGSSGGTALRFDMNAVVDNSGGEIWGGGGGGGPGIETGVSSNGGAGGDPGEDGNDGTGSLSPGMSGSSGKAIDLQGNSITWLGGSGNPNVKGAVS